MISAFKIRHMICSIIYSETADVRCETTNVRRETYYLHNLEEAISSSMLRFTFAISLFTSHVSRFIQHTICIVRK